MCFQIATFLKTNRIIFNFLKMWHKREGTTFPLIVVVCTGFQVVDMSQRRTGRSSGWQNKESTHVI